MPDTDALSYAATLEGEHTMRFDRLMREARDLEQRAISLRAEADREAERARWAAELAKAVSA